MTPPKLLSVTDLSMVAGSANDRIDSPTHAVKQSPVHKAGQSIARQFARLLKFGMPVSSANGGLK